MKTVFIDQILKNVLANGSEVIVRVMSLNVADTEMVRVCDYRETLPDGYLIEKNKTWAAPLENLRSDDETKRLTEKAFEPMSHKDSLIHWKF
jgi:hypothetical protein